MAVFYRRKPVRRPPSASGRAGGGRTASGSDTRTFGAVASGSGNDLRRSSAASRPDMTRSFDTARARSAGARRMPPPSAAASGTASGFAQDPGQKTAVYDAARLRKAAANGGSGQAQGRGPAQAAPKKYKAKSAGLSAENRSAIEKRRAKSAPVRRTAVRTVAPKVRTVKVKATTPFPIGIIIVCFFCVLLFMFILHNMVEINEKNTEVQNLGYQFDDLSWQKEELSRKLEEKNNLLRISEDAVNQLGMITGDQLEKQYIDISYSDEIVRPETEEGDFSFRLGGLFRSFEDKINSLIEYLR